MNREKLIKHFILLGTYEIFVSLNSIILEANILGYIFLSWGIPIIYYIYKLKNYRYKILFYGILFSFPGGIAVDLIGSYLKAWDWWNNPSVAVTGIKILGCPIEVFIWGTAFWLFCICLYEYTLDKNKQRGPRKDTKYFIILSYVIAAAIIVIIGKQPDIAIPFYYAHLVILLLVFNLIILLINKKLFMKLALYGLLMFPLAFIFEITSLALNLWSFHSDYLFTVQLISKSVPFEELLFLLIVPIDVIGFYEYFVDNKK